MGEKALAEPRLSFLGLMETLCWPVVSELTSTVLESLFPAHTPKGRLTSATHTSHFTHTSRRDGDHKR